MVLLDRVLVSFYRLSVVKCCYLQQFGCDLEHRYFGWCWKFMLYWKLYGEVRNNIHIS